MDLNQNLAKINEYHKAAARMEKKKQLLAQSRMNQSIAPLAPTKIVPQIQVNQAFKFILNRDQPIKLQKPVVNGMEKLIFRTHIPSIKSNLIEQCCSKFSQICQIIGDRFQEKLVHHDTQMKQIKVRPVSTHNLAQQLQSEVSSEMKPKNVLSYDWSFEQKLEKEMVSINIYPERNQFVDNQVQELQSMFSPINLMDNSQNNFQNQTPLSDSDRSNLQINNIDFYKHQESLAFSPEEQIFDYCSSFNAIDQFKLDKLMFDNQFQFEPVILKQIDQNQDHSEFDQQDFYNKLSIINKEKLIQTPVNVPHNTFQKSRENSLANFQESKQINCSKTSRISRFDDNICDQIIPHRQNISNQIPQQQFQVQQNDSPIENLVIQLNDPDLEKKESIQDPVIQVQRQSYQFSAAKLHVNPDVIQKWKKVKFV